jgi:hypothetical protein
LTGSRRLRLPEWYKWFVARYEEEEAEPIAYEEVLWDIIDEMLQFAPEEVRERPLKDMEWARDPEVRTGVRRTIADRGDTAQFLASRGIVLTPKVQERFLDCVLDSWRGVQEETMDAMSCRTHFRSSLRGRSSEPAG